MWNIANYQKDTRGSILHSNAIFVLIIFEGSEEKQSREIKNIEGKKEIYQFPSNYNGKFLLSFACIDMRKDCGLVDIE